MNQVIKQILEGKQDNHISPFFWQHGEDEATLREYMRIINEAGCGAVCIESRPHPDFCGPRWWQDMDVILDEARKRDMKVWILDDDHFPTGHANGAVINALPELCRQSLYSITKDFDGPVALVEFSEVELLKEPVYPKNQMELAMEQFRGPPQYRRFEGNSLLSVCAVPLDVESPRFDRVLDLTPLLRQGKIRWEKPAGAWRVYTCGLSRNYGPHRDYINMMDRDSCRLLIDAVYEPHYERYKNDFGKTIAGFFSDEPELGNGQLYPSGNILGAPQDLPWSRALGGELQNAMRPLFGENWGNLLPLLWETNADPEITTKVRSIYMDKVTRLVESCFSAQIGEWCDAHGVEYIGHIIEDNNQHARTGSSLGHFFRGLTGQHMAGIDDIGGQVLPQGEDEPTVHMSIMPRDGEFYHYLLGKLGASCAVIDPRKKGRALCEIFGNYGWNGGVYLDKYLVDHFLVRGINYFIPHAFSPKVYPDPDCPPHFYAHGHNPQYRHFGVLMRYTNRLCHLLSEGFHIASVALLYHAEAEWSGGEYMLTQKPARELTDNQIDFDIIPADVFSESTRYQTNLEEGLRVNTQTYKALVIPAAHFLPDAAARAAGKLHRQGFPVIFVDRLPETTCTGDDELLEALKNCPVVSLDNLAHYLRGTGCYEIEIEPANNRLRYYHYHNGGDIFLFVNEGVEVYSGIIKIPLQKSCFVYNAWDNRIERTAMSPSGNGVRLSVCIEPRKSLTLIFGEAEHWPIYDPPAISGGEIPFCGWKRSLCKGIEYPNFYGSISVELPDSLTEQKPEFSGFVRYETEFVLDKIKPLLLEITNAAEGVEVFVNGKSAGIQIVPSFCFDLSGFVRVGKNMLAIEVATTLERERYANMTNLMEKARAGEPSSCSGITGIVKLKY